MIIHIGNRERDIYAIQVTGVLEQAALLKGIVSESTMMQTLKWMQRDGDFHALVLTEGDGVVVDPTGTIKFPCIAYLDVTVAERYQNKNGLTTKEKASIQSEFENLLATMIALLAEERIMVYHYLFENKAATDDTNSTADENADVDDIED